MATDQDNYQALACVLVDESAPPVDLTFSSLENITEYFSDDHLVGRGGFGAVYKGKLPNGMFIAVKKLHEKIDVLEKNFENEVECHTEVRHKNIVRFVGYCSETRQVLTRNERGKRVLADVRQRLICFEYLSQGSLADYIKERSSKLEWRVCYQIIKGICDGVRYLHQQRIVHMDLKPANILLSNSMEAKIADFGLSRRFGEDQTRTITENIVGTRGYLAPEFREHGTITFKVDIYSVGVMIIEILTGSKECPNVDEVRQCWANIFDMSERHSLLQVQVCCEIGISCMDAEPRNRPTIEDIIRRLDEVGM